MKYILPKICDILIITDLNKDKFKQYEVGFSLAIEIISFTIFPIYYISDITYPYKFLKISVNIKPIKENFTFV